MKKVILLFLVLVLISTVLFLYRINPEKRKFGIPEIQKTNAKEIVDSTACENYQDIQTFEKPVPISWEATLDGCVRSCEGASFTKVDFSKDEKYSRFVGYMKEGQIIPEKYLKDGLKLKITGEWTGVDVDYAKTIFGNKCVPVVDIIKIELVK